MSSEINSELVEPKSVESSRGKVRPLIDEAVTAHLLQVFGDHGQSYIPTQAQVDKIIALQEKGMDYTHKERTTFSPGQKIQREVFIIGLLVLLAVFVLTLLYAKEYIGEVIAGILGLLAGGAGGYGMGKSYNKDNNK